MKRGPILRAVLTALALVIQLGLAHAFDDASLTNAEQQAVNMRADLDHGQAVLNQPSATDDELADLRNKIEQLRLDSVTENAKLNAPLDAVKQQLNQLGLPPVAGQSEAQTISSQRVTLTDVVSRFAAAKKQFELIGVEAEQMSGKISAEQRTQFFQRIFRADKSILNPRLWQDAATGTSLLVSRMGNLVSFWWQNQAANARWAGLLLVPAVIGFFWSVYRLIRANLKNWLPRRSELELSSSPLRRLWRVTWGMLLIITISLLFNLLISASLDASNLMTARFDLLVSAVLYIITPCFIKTGLAYLICAPRQPSARLISVDERSANTIPIFVLLASLVQSIASEVTSLSDQLLLPFSLVAGQSAIAATALIVIAGLMLVVLKQQANAPPADVPEPHFLAWFVNFMPVLWLFLGVAVLGLVFGYLALAYFIAGKILDTVLVIVVMVLIHHLIDAVADTLQNPASNLGQQLRRMSSIGDRGISRVSLAFRTLTDVLLVVLGIPWLFALWTVTWVDFRSLFNNAVVGFHIGNITVSPFSILNLLGILIAGIILTRFITGWFDRRVLTQTRLNKGVQDSLRTGGNYFGYILAGAIALSAAGFDFSSITIIAGALGVGIGFGLQSIVNNFVSGLILLAERPIRVGDWVVIAAGEGIVKKINVRSTEIETFDNCTIIVPNSSLITEPVRNWTHRDTLGRFLVTVGVAHGTEADAVAKALIEIVASHPKVLRYPTPLVQLSKFSAGATDFEIRGHVADVFEAAQVSSDLRFAISKSFAEKKFVIPSTIDIAVRK
jgi:potassium-dependent mechanosensitive channel